MPQTVPQLFFNSAPLPFIKKWLIKNQITVDESQSQAIELCFSHKLTLIQGPSGTGKTFVGVNIVRILLEKAFQPLLAGPIIIVCYTNHALDQFLLYIEKHTQLITRFGSRSKHPELEKYALKEKRNHPDFKKFKDLGSGKHYERRKKELKEFKNILYKYQLFSQYQFIAVKEIADDHINEEYFKIISKFYTSKKKQFFQFFKNKKTLTKEKKADFNEVVNFLKKNFGILALGILFWLDVLNFSFILDHFLKDYSSAEKTLQRRHQQEEAYKKKT